jgi:anti-sigma regulatory factor (Ser/Thr protein kinase)
VTETSSATLSQSYPATPASVREGRDAVVALAAAAGGSREQLEAIRLACSEALTNVVVHAYPGAAGQLHVSAGVVRGELWVLVADDGCGLRAHSDGPGLGFGLKLIAKSTDGLAIVKRSSGGTELRMRFNLSSDGDWAEDQPRGSVSSARAPASPRF